MNVLIRNCFRLTFHIVVIISIFLTSSCKIFFESSTYSAVSGCSTSFTLATETDSFSGYSHVTDTFIGISNLPCTNVEAIGFFFKNFSFKFSPFSNRKPDISRENFELQNFRKLLIFFPIIYILFVLLQTARDMSLLKYFKKIWKSFCFGSL